MSYLKNEDFQVQVSLPFLAKIIYYFVIIFFLIEILKYLKYLLTRVSNVHQ